MIKEINNPYWKTAPFTHDEVQLLVEWQLGDKFHPYTHQCGQLQKFKQFGSDGKRNLIPSVNGWYCLHCDYTQKTALVASKHEIDTEYTHNLTTAILKGEM